MSRNLNKILKKIGLVYIRDVREQKQITCVDTLGSFSAIFTLETEFVTCLLPVHNAPSKRGSTLKGKHLLPLGEDPISERRQKQNRQSYRP